MAFRHTIPRGCAGLIFGLCAAVFLTSNPASAQSRKHIRQMVVQEAARHGVPARLALAVVHIESRYRPRAISRGNYGLMQIRLGTARAMGFRGSSRALLVPRTNLKYGMKYLARAWRASGGSVCGTIKRYQTGYGGKHLSAATRRYCTKARRLMASR